MEKIDYVPEWAKNAIIYHIYPIGFFGVPKYGKSHILEALACLSFYLRPRVREADDLANFVRFTHRSDLFYDNEVSQPINIQFDDFSLGIEYKENLIDELSIEARPITQDGDDALQEIINFSEFETLKKIMVYFGNICIS